MVGSVCYRAGHRVEDTVPRVEVPQCLVCECESRHAELSDLSNRASPEPRGGPQGKAETVLNYTKYDARFVAERVRGGWGISDV